MKKVKRYGEDIVADPAICHGAPTFRGTRIFVKDVLWQVAAGASLLKQLDRCWLNTDAERVQ